MTFPLSELLTPAELNEVRDLRQRLTAVMEAHQPRDAAYTWLRKAQHELDHTIRQTEIAMTGDGNVQP